MRKTSLSLLLTASLLAACSNANNKTVIYPAETIITMAAEGETANAIAVKGDTITGVGELSALTAQFPKAKIDKSFEDLVITPGFIDPHIHMVLASLFYSVPMAPPWDMEGAEGTIKGLETRESFLARLAEIEGEKKGDKPLIIYGYHNLVHGDLTRQDLDKISTERPLFIWHYSGHDFYLNTKALEWAEITPALHEQYEGIGLDQNGELTGRVYEDAALYLYKSMAKILITPGGLGRGHQEFSELLRRGGVTTVADLGYGIFTLFVENTHIGWNWKSPKKSGYKLYLVPEHRAFEREFGENRVEEVLKRVSGKKKTPAPVLPQVKFFTDGAFYSQTMRLAPPGYLTGQSEGTKGLWVTQPDDIADMMRPYWEAGLSVRVHSNGDAAQTATLNALEELRETSTTQRFAFEHGGLFSPEDVKRAGELDAIISAASHYVFFMGETYQPPLGEERGDWISPLASLSNSGSAVTLHSDAPLAPPLPLRAAGIHVTRETKEGTVITPEERLTPYDAMEAITIDAAYTLGLENEIGSLEVGKKADFTILEQNPLEVDGGNWRNINIWGVVLNGEKRPLED